MAPVLALAAAVLYSSPDFLGGAGSRQASALSFPAASAPAGAVIMLEPRWPPAGPAPAAPLG